MSALINLFIRLFIMIFLFKFLRHFCCDFYWKKDSKWCEIYWRCFCIFFIGIWWELPIGWKLTDFMNDFILIFWRGVRYTDFTLIFWNVGIKFITFNAKRKKSSQPLIHHFQTSRTPITYCLSKSILKHQKLIYKNLFFIFLSNSIFTFSSEISN